MTRMVPDDAAVLKIHHGMVYNLITAVSNCRVAHSTAPNVSVYNHTFDVIVDVRRHTVHIEVTETPSSKESVWLPVCGISKRQHSHGGTNASKRADARAKMR